MPSKNNFFHWPFIEFPNKGKFVICLFHHSTHNSYRQSLLTMFWNKLHSFKSKYLSQFFLGPRGSLVEPSIPSNFFLFSFFFSFFLFLLLSRDPWSPLTPLWPLPPPVTQVVVIVVLRLLLLKQPASCKWSSRGTSLLQMIIRRGRPLANDHPEGPALCKWSSGGADLSQMIIRRDQLLVNDHSERSASCK